MSAISSLILTYFSKSSLAFSLLFFFIFSPQIKTFRSYMLNKLDQKFC